MEFEELELAWPTVEPKLRGSRTQYTFDFYHWAHCLCLWRPFGPYPSSNFSVSQCEFYIFLQPSTIFWALYTASHFMDPTTWDTLLYRWGDSFIFRWTMVTPYPRVDSESSLYISQNQTPSTMAPTRSHITSWWSWTSKIDGVLSTTVFSRCLEHMEWSRIISQTSFDLWWSSKNHWTIHSPYDPEKIQMGHQYPFWFAIWFRFLEKEETIQEGPYIDFLLSKQIRETSTGYSPYHRFHAVTTLAPNYGTTGRASDLANCSSFSVRYTFGCLSACRQWWSSWIFQFSSTRSASWCSQFFDFGMETSSPRHCPFCRHVTKGQSTTTFLHW